MARRSRKWLVVAKDLPTVPSAIDYFGRITRHSENARIRAVLTPVHRPQGFPM